MRPHQQHIIRKQGYNYLLYLPRDYGVGKKWPLIIFLHGTGERGSNLNLLKKTALPHDLEEIEYIPFVVVSPQCPRGSFWSASLIHKLLDDVTTRYKIDEDRVYLTGISMGGFGTWEAAAAQPWRFAAIAPISGGGNPELASRLRDLPVWVFHGAMDDVVPLNESRTMVETIEKLGGSVRFTIYPDAGHDSWTRTYNSLEIYQWFLSHSRAERLDSARGKGDRETA